MSDYSDDPFDPAQGQSGGTTQPSDPAQRAARRPIPSDEMPASYSRPALSRRPQAQPQPPQDHISVPVPPGNPYQEAPRQGRGRRARARANRAPRPPIDKSRSGLYLPWWSLLLLLAFVGCAAFGVLLLVNSMEYSGTSGGQTPIVVVITATFTVGPPASPTPIPQKPTLTPSPPLPTIPPTLTLPPGNFAIGEIVVVVGTGDSGLNVRSAPSTTGTVKFRAHDGESYILRDGPQQASGEEWWLIADQADSTKSGWASRRFLSIQSAAPATAT